MWAYAVVVMLATVLCRKKIIAYATLLRCYTRPAPKYQPPYEYGSDDEAPPPLFKID